MSPVISVNMPVYNCERYLPEAIDSILGQTFSNLELVAINDGSNDRSWEILQEYAARDCRMVIRTRPNQGIVATRNEALQLSRGEFIAILDSDDVALPDRLERQVAYLQAHRECIAVGGRALMIDPDGDPLCEWSCCSTLEEIRRTHLEGRSGLAHSTCTMRREEVLAAGGYRTSFDTSEDYDLLLRLEELGELVNLPIVVSKYRQHLQSATHVRNGVQRQAAQVALREARAAEAWRRSTSPMISWLPRSGSPAKSIAAASGPGGR